MEIYKKQWSECKSEEARLLGEKENLKQLLLSRGEKQERIEAIKRLYSQIKEGLKNASSEIKYQLIQRLINKITVKGKVLEIEYDLPVLEKIEAGKREKYEPISSFCFNNKRISCKNKKFRVFTRVELLPRSEISKKIWERRKELAKV